MLFPKRYIHCPFKRNCPTRIYALSLSSCRVNVSTLDDNGFIKHVQLNRPEKHNALDIDMFEAIARVATDLQDDKIARAVILSGTGKSFCTGLDIGSVTQVGSVSSTIGKLLKRPSGYGNYNQAYNGAVGNLAQDVAYLWRRLHIPVIAAIHGKCFGGGLQIALGADLRFATPDSNLAIMESRWGLIPDMTASITLRELVRIDVAKELTMTGRIITGDEAAALGLVTRCVADPLEEAKTVAADIAARSPDAVSASKKLFQETWISDEKFCLEKETELQKSLLVTWNQLIASGKQIGINFPFFSRKG